jgi:hypothetical protein
MITVIELLKMSSYTEEEAIQLFYKHLGLFDVYLKYEIIYLHTPDSKTHIHETQKCISNAHHNACLAEYHRMKFNAAKRIIELYQLNKLYADQSIALKNNDDKELKIKHNELWEIVRNNPENIERLSKMIKN